MDNSKEGLIYQNKKAFFAPSFDSIPEKQEEMSVESIPSNRENKNDNTIKNEKESITKNVLENGDLQKSIEKQKKKKSVILNKKNSINQRREDSPKRHDNKEGIFNKGSPQRYKSIQNKKSICKRNSVQNKGPYLAKVSISSLNKSEITTNFKNGRLSKRGTNILNSFNNSYLLQNNSKNFQEQSFRRHLSKTRSISNTALEMQYINKAKAKKSTLKKINLNFNNKTQTSIFDLIKNSDLFEKSQHYLFKIKICYGILAFSSFLCIILSCIDTITFNHKSLDYLKNYGINHTFYDVNNNIDYYYYNYINKRKITSKENTIRIFNGIFSFINVIVVLIIYAIKNSSFKKTKKIEKRENFNRILNRYYVKQRKKSLSKNKINKEDKNNNDKIKMVDFSKNDFSEEIAMSQRRTRMVRKCILNMIFYPPYINLVFIGKHDNIFYIYSLNSIFLIISLYKISNIYKTIFYLSPLNNSINKAICRTNLFNLNSKFMFKYSLNKFPITFLALNIVVIVIFICLNISCVEFFSLDVNNNFFNFSIENQDVNVFNIFSSFFFFIIKNMYEEHCIKSILGKIILFIGGLIGMLISSYFIFLMNNLVNLKPEEHNAFSKLLKLLDPVNRENKASNFIKSLLLFKKIIKDNINTEKEYRDKKEELKRPINLQRRPIFPGDNNFNLMFNENSTNNLNNLNEINENEEKKRYIRYLGGIFIFKIKFILEYKSFEDDLKVARNSSLSFTDVLKTVGNKMEGNITQLNNKIEVLIQNGQKYINFIKDSVNTIKKIKKIRNYQESMIQYLVEVHNEYLKQMVELKNDDIIYKNNFKIPKKQKSNYFGKLSFRNRMMKSRIINSPKIKKRLKKEIFDLNYVKNNVKKQRSSIVFSNYLDQVIKDNIKMVKIKQNTNKSRKTRKSRKSRRSNKSSNKRTKSVDNWNNITNDLKVKLNPRNSLVNKARRASVSVIKSYKK